MNINKLYCGNVDTLNQVADLKNTTIVVQNLLRSDNTSCYWKITVNETWEANETTILNVTINFISGFNVSIVNSTDSATTLYRNLTSSNTKNFTKLSFTGSNYTLYIIAIPLTNITKNTLNFTFIMNGTQVN